MSEKPNIDISNDLLFKLTLGSLWFSGVFYILLGLGLGAFFVLMPEMMGDPEMPAWFSLAMGVVMLVVSLACAVGNFVVARGLSKRKSWAWVGAVVIGGIYAPSGCILFGVLILVTVLRPGFRESYLAEGQEKF
jgi:drug/metabolite transporter (DMT)-like permease